MKKNYKFWGAVFAFCLSASAGWAYTYTQQFEKVHSQYIQSVGDRITDVSELEPGSAYILECAQSSTVYGYLCQSYTVYTSTSISTSGNTGYVFDSRQYEDANAKNLTYAWTLGGDATNGYTFQNAATSQYIPSLVASTDVQVSSTPGTFTITASGTSGKFVIQDNSSSAYFNSRDAANGQFCGWASSYSYCLRKVTIADTPDAYIMASALLDNEDCVGGYSSADLNAVKAAYGDGTVTSDYSALTTAVSQVLTNKTPLTFDNTKTYTLQNTYTGDYVVYDAAYTLTSSSTTYTGSNFATIDVNTNPEYLWMFYTASDGICLFNVSGKQFIENETNRYWPHRTTPSPLTLEENTKTVNFGGVDKTLCDSWRIYSTNPNSTTNKYMRLDNNGIKSTFRGISSWAASSNANDALTHFRIKQTDVPSLVDLDQRDKVLASIPADESDYTDYLGALNSAEDAAAFQSVANPITNATLISYLDQMALLTTPDPDAYYRIESAYGFADDKAISEGSEDNTVVSWSTASTSSVPMLWKYSSGGYLTSANSGKKLTLSGSSVITDETGTAITLVQNATDITKFALKLGETDNSLCLQNASNEVASVSDSEGTVTANADITGAKPTLWRLRKVHDLIVNVGTTGYATINLPFAVTLPTGISAYSVSAVGTSSVSISPLSDDVLSANTPMILHADEGEYTLGISTETGSAPDDNFLQGSLQATSPVVANSIFGLGENTEGVAVFMRTAAIGIPANKAYLNASDLALGAKEMLDITLGGVTAIEQSTVDATKSTSDIYDLSGRKVVTPIKGIYITNGKRYIYR